MANAKRTPRPEGCEGFEIIYRQAATVILTYLRCHNVPREIVEDLAQEGLVVVYFIWQNDASFPNPDRTVPKVTLKVARNLLGTRWRDASRPGKYSAAHLTLDEIAEHVADETDLELQVERAERNAALADAVRQLSRRCQQVLCLKYEWEMTYAAIARRLGIGAGSVHTFMSSALSALETLLQKHAPEGYTRRRRST